MSWNRKIAQEQGHGDTLNGQMMHRELRRVSSEIAELRSQAAEGGPDDVLPRWKGDIKRRIYLLPSLEAVARMSMCELEAVAAEVDEVRAEMSKFSIRRFREITDAR